MTPHDDEFEVRIGATRLSRKVVTVAETPFEAAAEPVRYTAIHFAISDQAHPKAFPRVEADLEAVARPDGTTELAIDGWYEPPTRTLGDAIDAAGLGRIARPAIRRHFTEILTRVQDAAQRRLQMLGESH